MNGTVIIVRNSSCIERTSSWIRRTSSLFERTSFTIERNSPDFRGHLRLIERTSSQFERTSFAIERNSPRLRGHLPRLADIITVSEDIFPIKPKYLYKKRPLHPEEVFRFLHISSAAPEPRMTPAMMKARPSRWRAVMTSPRNRAVPIKENIVLKLMKIAAFDGPTFPTE